MEVRTAVGAVRSRWTPNGTPVNGYPTGRADINAMQFTVIGSKRLCLDGRFTATGATMRVNGKPGVLPEDLVLYKEWDGATFQGVYCGIVKTAPNPASTTPQECILESPKRLLYDTMQPAYTYTMLSQDVTYMAWAVVTNWVAWHAGYPSSGTPLLSWDATTQPAGVTLGTIFKYVNNAESYGDTLDMIATNSGTTWGVTPDARVWLGVTHTLTPLNQKALGLVVDRPVLGGEPPVTLVNWQLGLSNIPAMLVDPAPVGMGTWSGPLRMSQWGAATAARVVTNTSYDFPNTDTFGLHGLRVPIAGNVRWYKPALVTNAWWSGPGVVAGSFLNVGDNNDDTYVDVTGFQLGTLFIEFAGMGAQTIDGVMLNIESLSNTQIAHWQILQGAQGVGPGGNLVGHAVSGYVDGLPPKGLLLIPDEAKDLGYWHLRLSLTLVMAATDGAVRIREFMPIIKDYALMDSMAKGYYKTPGINVAELTADGWHAPSDLVSVNLSNGGLLGPGAVEGVTYTRGAMGQLSTTWHFGQSGLRADDVAVASLIKRRDADVAARARVQSSTPPR